MALPRTVRLAALPARCAVTPALARLVAAINSHDIAAIDRCYRPQAPVREADWPEPMAASNSVQTFSLLYESFPDLRAELLRAAHTDREVLAEVALLGTSSGPPHLDTVDQLLLGTGAEQTPPTPRMTGVVVLEMADALISAECQYWPSVEPLRQLALLSAPARA